MIWLPALSLKVLPDSASRCHRAAAGRIVTGGDDCEFAQGQLVGGDKFDDSVLILHGIGLDDAVLIHRLRL